MLVAVFATQPAAARFARRWARRLGVAVAVRPFACRRPGAWSASVPVAGCVPFKPAAPAWRFAGVRSVPAVAAAVSVALL